MASYDYEERVRAREAEKRAIGWRRFRLIARTVGTVVGVVAAFTLSLLGVFGGQGGLIALHVLLAVLCACLASWATLAYVHFLGNDDDVIGFVICGTGVIGLWAVVVTFATCAVLAICGAITW